MHIKGDEIASLVIAQYKSLPTKGKPLLRSNGVQEWTIIAGVVISNKNTAKLECVSLATGVKALPDEMIKNKEGKLLHDCHAEILAIRAFNLYCIIAGLDHIGAIYLYVCAPPCGDASMGLLNSAGDEWTRDTKPKPNELIRGRAHFNCLGHIRTKPGRADSNISNSKSCSDKLCLRQTRGLFLCMTRYLFNTTPFLDTLVCPSKGMRPLDFDRAFSRWEPSRRFNHMDTTIMFDDYHPDEGKPSPCSIIWTPHTYEIVANGVIQGSKGKSSAISRRQLFVAARNKYPQKFVKISRYHDLKIANTWPLGWKRTADDDFDVIC